MKGDSSSTVVGQRGTVVVPAPLRKRLGMHEGSAIIIEERDGGVLLRPALTLAVEVYTPQRRAEFLLTNAVTDEEYRQARREALSLGIDPDTVPHRSPVSASVNHGRKKTQT